MLSLGDCVTDFSILTSGRKRGEKVVVGDHPELARTKNLYVSRIVKNWPSQWHSRFEEGYLELSNGKLFCLKNKTIEGIPVFLFRYSVEARVRVRRQRAQGDLCTAKAMLDPGDRSALANLILEHCGRRTLGLMSLDRADEVIECYMLELSLKELKLLVEMARPGAPPSTIV